MHLICTPPPHPLQFFLFLQGITAVPREIENKAYAKFFSAGVGGGGGGNKVHCGRCASGDCIITGENLTGIN